LARRDVFARYGEVFSRANRVNYVPVVAVRGRNAVVWDAEGRRYIDFTSSAAVVSVGYCNERVVKAVTEQVASLNHFTYIYGFSEPALELGERLLKISPVRGAKVSLGLSGSDANECALLLAKAFSGRRYVISYSNGFHGCTLASLSASGVGLAREVRGLVGSWGDVIFIEYPDCYRSNIGEPWRCRDVYVEGFKEVVEEVGEDAAALIAEPIQGDGGVVVPPEGYFAEVKRVLDRYGILLIADEVQTGLGRTGRWFGMEHYGVVPDLITLGKPLGGGLPISAVIGREDVMNSLPPLAYTFTLAGNPVACRAAVAVIDEIEEKDLVRRARALGDLAMRRLREMGEEHGLIGDVRGKGLMIGVDLVRDRESKERAYVEAKKVVWRAYQLGLIVFFVSGNVLRIQPPLTIEEENLSRGLDILEQAIRDVEEGRVGNEALEFVKGW